jgi:hypothetical protein
MLGSPTDGASRWAQPKQKTEPIKNHCHAEEAGGGGGGGGCHQEEEDEE